MKKPALSSIMSSNPLSLGIIRTPKIVSNFVHSLYEICDEEKLFPYNRQKFNWTFTTEVKMSNINPIQQHVGNLWKDKRISLF